MNPIHEAWKATLRALRRLLTKSTPVDIFTTRLNDFKQAAARAQAACQKLTLKANK